MGVMALLPICESSFTSEDYNTCRTHYWSPFPPRRAHPGPGPHSLRHRGMPPPAMCVFHSAFLNPLPFMKAKTEDSWKASPFGPKKNRLFIYKTLFQLLSLKTLMRPFPHKTLFRFFARGITRLFSQNTLICLFPWDMKARTEDSLKASPFRPENHSASLSYETLIRLFYQVKKAKTEDNSKATMGFEKVTL